MKRAPSKIDTIPVADAVDDFYSAVPRLIIVAGRAVISFALWQGVNRALLAEGGSDDVRELAAGYGGDNAHTCVIRLCALLDGDRKMVSFKRIDRLLQRPDVVEGIVARSVDPHFWPGKAVRGSLEEFRKAYQDAFINDLHSRLIHFRNVGVAHLSLEEIKRRVTYDEVQHLTRAVARMSESLSPFAPDHPLLIWEHEIDNWSDRARKTWMTALDLATASA